MEKSYTRQLLNNKTKCKKWCCISHLTKLHVLFGGYGGSGRLDDFWEFNFDSNLWRNVETYGQHPGARENNGSVVYKNHM